MLKTNYPPVNVDITNWKDLQFLLWEGPLFRLFDWAIFNSFSYVYQAG